MRTVRRYLPVESVTASKLFPFASLTARTTTPGSTPSVWSVIFFFQAEDGIRDLTVTGVQTCALPISAALLSLDREDARLVGGIIAYPARDGYAGRQGRGRLHADQVDAPRNHLPSRQGQIGRASCRERV